VTEQKTCLRTLVDVASAAHDSRGVEDALDRILRSGCSDDQECVADAVYVAQIEKRENNSVAALAAYRRAYEHGAGNAGLLEQMAVLASQAGLHVEAASDYDTLARLRPDDPRWREAAGREHEIILRLRAMP
jgi:hypothetical protein